MKDIFNLIEDISIDIIQILASGVGELLEQFFLLFGQVLRCLHIDLDVQISFSLSMDVLYPLPFYLENLTWLSPWRNGQCFSVKICWHQYDFPNDEIRRRGPVILFPRRKGTTLN